MELDQVVNYLLVIVLLGLLAHLLLSLWGDRVAVMDGVEGILSPSVAS